MAILAHGLAAFSSLDTLFPIIRAAILAAAVPVLIIVRIKLVCMVVQIVLSAHGILLNYLFKFPHKGETLGSHATKKNFIQKCALSKEDYQFLSRVKKEGWRKGRK